MDHVAKIVSSPVVPGYDLYEWTCACGASSFPFVFNAHGYPMHNTGAYRDHRWHALTLERAEKERAE